MADNVLDRVAFEVGADLGPLKAAYAQADAETDALASRIKSKTSSAFFSDTQAGAQRLLAARQAVSQFGDDTEKSMKRAHGSVAVATREFRALFDEISSGRVRQSPGTLAIIATRVFGISGAALAAGAAVIGIGAAFGVAAVMAESNLAKIRTSLALTAYQSGATSSQLVAMADAAAAANGISSGRAQGLAGAFAGRSLPFSVMSQAIGASAAYGNATGAKDKDIEAMIAKMFDEPSKSAHELNQQMRLLSAAQTREVEDLEAAGETQKAGQIILDAFSQRAKEASLATASFSQALHNFIGNIGTWWNGVGKSMGFGLSAQEQIARNNQIIASHGVQFAMAGGTAAQQAVAHAMADNIRLREAMAGEGQNAAAGARRKAQDEAVTAALQYRSKLDVAGKKLEEEANARGALTTGLKQAQAQLADLQAKHASPGEIAAAQRNLRDIQTMSANAANPNYKWGSGIPKGHDKFTEANPFRRDAETAQQELANAQQVAATDERDRKSVEAKLKAELEYQRNIRNPTASPYAAAIRDAHLGMAGLQQSSARADFLTNAREQAKAEETVAAAFEKGTRAAIDATIAGEAHRAWVKGEIDDENAYADALRRRASAQAAASVAQQIERQRQSNTALGRLVAAGGSPAALAAAQRENEALSATQAERDNARSAEQIALADKHLAQLREELALRDRLAQDQALNQDIEQLREAIILRQKELDLKYADADLRAKELADLMTRQELLRRGYKPGTPEYDEAYRKLGPINQRAQLQAALQDKPQVQMLDTIRTGITNVAIAGVHGFGAMKEAAASFLSQLAQMVIQLYIIRPLLNLLLDTGTTPGGLLGGIFGGGKASGGWIDPGKFYVVGEKGPEILGPGVGGKVSPIEAPHIANMGGTQMAMTVNHNVAIQVSGVGDKQLLENVHAAAQQTVVTGLSAYGKVQAKTQRGTLIAQNKRALV